MAASAEEVLRSLAAQLKRPPVSVVVSLEVVSGVGGGMPVEVSVPGRGVEGTVGL